MTIQRRRRFLPFVLGHRTACHSVSSLMLLALLVMGLPVLSGAQQACHPDGDVDRNGSVTAADALLAFQQALGLTQLTACQRDIADVTPLPSAPDGNITASDALCIFQKALSLPSCLDTLPSTNLPPVADAGEEQFVFGNEVVMLTGSGSDTDGTVVRYRWMQTSGPTVVLSGADTPNASFTAPEVTFENLIEELEFQLTVTDDDGASDTAVVLVVVIYDPLTNEAPTANAGFDQTVSEGTLVTLSGSGSDPDGIIIAYNWLQTSGTPVELIGGDTPNPGFFAPEVNSDEELVFQLAVFDDEFGFAADTVTVTVLNGVSNTPPVADAGRDRTVDENTEVTLSGSGTDSDGTIVSYRWTQTSGTPVTLSGASTQAASFTTPDVDSDEDLVFELTVTDDGGVSHMDTATITVRAAPASSGLREMVFENPGHGEPSYVIAGDSASLQYWTDPSGTASQALYENVDGTERVRIFYDVATGAPRTVLNEVTGHWLSIREAGSNRIDFWTYDGGGSYLGGFAIYEVSGQYYTGDIVGVPAHEWSQITGQFNPTGASWTGDFMLTGDIEDGLENVQLLPPEFTTLVDLLAPTGTPSASTANEDYQPIIPSHNRTHAFLVDLLAPTGLTGTSPANDGYPPIATDHNRAHTFRTIGGYAFLGGVLLATSPATATIGLVLGVGGAAFVAGSFIYDAIGEGLRNDMHSTCPGSDAVASPCRKIYGMAANLFTDPAGGLVGRVQDMVDWVKDRPARLVDKVSRGLGSITDITDELPPGYQFGAVNNSMPASLIGPPTMLGHLSGTASGPSGGVTRVTGTINTSGGFNVSGPNVTISGSYTNGAVTGGTFQHGTSSGTISQPGGTSQLSAFIPSDAEASAFFPTETNYVRENCSPRSCSALFNCYRCSALFNSYRCSALFNSYRCSALFNSYRCSGSGPAVQACRNERDSNVKSCRSRRDDYYDSCRMERDNHHTLCKNQRDTNYNTCKASQ